MNKYCCISDLHLGCHGDSPSWHSTTLTWGKWLKNELESKGISDIIICGDFFNNRNEIGVNTISVASELMSIWKDFDIIMISGNHDLFYKDRTDVTSISIFEGHSNIEIISDMDTRTINGKIVTFIPWGQDIKKCPKSDIIFGHLEIDGFRMMPGRIAQGCTTPRSLTSKSDLVFSGHFHLRDERKYKNGKIIYVGSPYQMNWGEAGNIPGYYIVDIGNLEYTFSENTISPVYVKLDSNDISKNNIEGNIVSIDIDSSMPEDEIEKLKQSIYSKNPSEIKFNILREDLSSDTKIEYDGTVDILEVMNQYVDDLSLDDYSDDVKDALKELFENYKK